MKTAVLGEDLDGLVIYNRALLDLARHYGFQPRACRPYRPKTKGKVERPFRYIREDFFLGTPFAGAFQYLWIACLLLAGAVLIFSALSPKR